MAKPAYRGGYERQRRELLADGPTCVHCGWRTATRADHQPPLSLHHHVQGTACCTLVPSCYECEKVQGGLLGGNPGATVRVELAEPSGFPVDDAVWDVPWLDALRDVPDNGTWPRLMTVPHPRAVASLGAEVAVWARERRGRAWRWWQHLAAARLLEIDAQGALVWETMLLTIARQVGKTWLLHDLCSWRLEQSARFGAEQLVLSTGKDLAVVREMQRPARNRAKQSPDVYKVREVNGQEEIEVLAEGARWQVRAKDGVYGISASMATVDEAWKVAAASVDDGLVPTMVEQVQAQLLLVSTAHRRATALMIGRRASALERLGDPGDDGLLLVEWSAGRGGELVDRQAWRQASPYWTPKRERVIAQRLEAAVAGESDDVDEPDAVESFRTQWLNQWPARRVAVERGELLVEPDDWRGATCDADSAGPMVIGVEDHYRRGAAVAFCAELPDGRFVLGGRLFATRLGAYEFAGLAVGARPGSTLVVGASLFDDAELVSILAVRRRAGSAETPAGLSSLRELLGVQVVHDDVSPELDAQVLAARVTVGANGLHLVSGPRSDLLRAAVWALRLAAVERMPAPAIHSGATLVTR
jgi:hypothetical protein